MRKNFIAVVALTLLLTACQMPSFKKEAAAKPLTLDEAKSKSIEFINDNLMQPGSKVSLKEAVEESGLFKIVVNLPNGQEVTSYMSKDGKTFFPQAMDVEKTVQEKQANEDQGEANETADLSQVPKAEKAKVEVFVMSHCPYGTQIEKGIIPAVKALGRDVDFQLKFCDYAMHGEKELDEQLTQVCINNTQPDKLIPYLECFLKDGNSGDCVKSTKIDAKKVAACVADTDKKHKVKEMFADESTWTNGRFPQFNVHKADNEKYGVKGSPTLVINGKTVSTQRDANSLLKAICAGYEKAPEACAKELSKDAPAPGFGTGTASGGSADAGCATE